MKIALVSMPWMECDIAPLGIASLKSSLAARGLEADGLYLNLLMYARAGSLAESLARDMTWSEWLFGYHLFGPGGEGVLHEELENVQDLPSFQEFLSRTKIAPSRLSRLLHDDIPSFLAECLRSVEWRRYDLIGFSSTFGSHTACLKLARELKARRPEVPIVFGGANVEGAMGPATLSACDWIDYVVDGEGEEALAALAKNLEAGRPFDRVPRVSYRRGSEMTTVSTVGAPAVDLDGLPPPDHGDFFAAITRYGLAGRLEPEPTFEASRGCWWGEKQHCTFCSFNGETMAFRAKSAANVVRDVISVCERHRATRLRAVDNIIGLEHLRELLPELARIRREREVDWEIFFEIKSNITAPQMAELARAGVTSLQPGIESLSTPTLRLMRKGVSAIQNVQTLKLGLRHGIDLLWNLIYGFPGEDPAELARMARIAPALAHLQPPGLCGPVRVERFSPYYFDWARFSSSKPRPQEFYRHVYPEDRFVLEQTAYRFDFADPPPTPGADELTKAVAFWQASWSRSLFAYRRGPGFCEVYDSRPSAVGRGSQFQQWKIDGLAATVFAACEAIAAHGEILSACRRDGFACEDFELAAVLDEFARRRWVYHEDGRFLNLAVPSSCLSSRHRLLFKQFREIGGRARQWRGGERAVSVLGMKS